MGEGASKVAAILSCLPPEPRKDLTFGCHSLSESESAYSDTDECAGSFPVESYNTLIVFDWDDTLLCTSAINHASRSAWKPSQLQQLEQTCQAVLRAAMELGETIIVTNGIQSWVQNSAGHYLPGLLPTLNNMRVLSARAKYEAQHPNNPFAWKKHAFKELLAERQERCSSDADNSHLNLVVLGDSYAEIDAARHAAKHYGGRPLLKTVKFKESPTVSELLGQLRRLSQELDQIVQERNNTHRGMSQQDHLDHLCSWASGWKCAEKVVDEQPLVPLLRAMFG